MVDNLGLPERALGISFRLGGELLLLLQKVPLAHLVLLLLQVLQVQLLLLRSQVGPCSLFALASLRLPAAVLPGSRGSLLLLALHRHLLHLLLHYEVFLLLFQDQQLLVLRHSLQLGRCHF